MPLQNDDFKNIIALYGEKRANFEWVKLEELTFINNIIRHIE